AARFAAAASAAAARGVGLHQRQKNTLAQPPDGEAQPVGRPDNRYRLENGAPGKHNVRPLLPYARMGSAANLIQLEQGPRDPAQLDRGSPYAVDAHPVVTFKAEMDARDGGDGAGSAEEVEGAVPGFLPLQPREERRKAFGDFGHHALVDLLRDLHAA